MAVKTTKLYEDATTSITSSTDSDANDITIVSINRDKKNPLAAVIIESSKLKESKEHRTWMELVPRDGSDADKFEAAMPDVIQHLIKSRRQGAQEKGEGVAALLDQAPDNAAENLAEAFRPYQPISSDVDKFIRNKRLVSGHDKEIKGFHIDPQEMQIDRLPERQVLGACLKGLRDKGQISPEACSRLGQLLDSITHDNLVEKPSAEQKRICGELMGKGRDGDGMAFGA